MSRHMEEARREEVRRAWLAGATARELAGRFGLSERYARKGCARGWEAGPGSGRPKLEPAEAVRRKRQRWRSWSSRHRRTIVARDRRRRRAARKEARRVEVRLLWSQGFTGPELSDLLGLPRSTIAGYVADLPRRTSFAAQRHASWPLPRRRLRRVELAPRIFRFAPRVEADRLPRSVGPRGSAHGRAKLIEAQVVEARRLRSEGWSTNALAARYGVSSNTICYALNGTTWGHIPGALPSPAPKKGGRG